ncbi:hypothetical protein C2E20_4746 [Micractinium conductrix]|uniref:SGNH hydrolase-type esterase domain-containing protein n=1 Tax=Micractinium conductrix TaxID=554055 RepID=A0A2P6VD47_9CHLO|nr:hypothetical protein C2E20_4746 [Micractinium conductrix]|eukprot:PSC72002.1 hypothetical protein C2E20_4746 [Micractinium conductrix]
MADHKQRLAVLRLVVAALLLVAARGAQDDADAACAPGPLPSPPDWALLYDPAKEKSEVPRQEWERNVAAVQAVNKAGERLDLLLLGDSITSALAGEHADLWEETFGDLQAERLGVFGNTVEELAWRVMVGGERVEEAPRVVALAIGVNNVQYGHPLPRTADRLAQLLAYLRAAWPGSTLVQLTLLPTTEADVGPANEAFREVAEQQGVAWSTCGSELDPLSSEEIEDGIHPAAGGYRTLLACLREEQPLQERPRKQQPEAAAQEPARACPHPLVSPAYLAELAAANAVIERLPLPGGLSFYPVHPSCALLPLCCAYGVSPAAICLGASYFQRLLAGNESLRAAALQSGYFSQCADGAVVMHARAGPAEEAALIYCACVYLGCKVTDGVRYAGQLSHMMSTLLSANICTSMATDLEMRCLKGLNWRLGPYCCRPGHQAGEWAGKFEWIEKSLEVEAGLSGSLLHEEPPITPLAAAGDDVLCSRDGSGRGGHASAAPAHGDSMLDSLLSTSLKELLSGQIRLGMPPLQVLSRAPASGAVPLPAPIRALVPPGAPRRVRALPPPPAVPEELLSGLRPLGGGADFSLASSGCTSTNVSGSLDGSTAASGAAPVPAALARALALLADCDPARHRAGGVV